MKMFNNIAAFSLSLENTFTLNRFSFEKYKMLETLAYRRPINYAEESTAWNWVKFFINITASLSALLVLKRLSKTWIFHHDHARKRKHEFKIILRYHLVKYLNGECDKHDNYIYIFLALHGKTLKHRKTSPLLLPRRWKLP